MQAYIIKNNGSSNNPCYPPDSHQCDNAVYWRTLQQAPSNGVSYVTTLMCVSACPLVSSSKTKPCQFSSVQFSSVTSLCTCLYVAISLFHTGSYFIV